MAPTKKDAEKEAKLTPEQSATMILDYLRKQNRPYSATDISTNLKNRVTKAAAAKLLKDMHERNEIEGRAAGKQLVYHAIQDAADEAGLERLQEMDIETTRLREETIAMKAEEKELRAALREGASQVPLSDLRSSVVSLEQEKVDLTARLAKLQSGNVKPVSAEERNKTNAEHKKWQKIASDRRKIRNEMWAEIAGMVEREKMEDIKEALDLSL
ncbi:hypothetical protein LTR78_002776 [Recurvomyces mirabilis]|uniref:Homologous-pairing protein 2 winged helix domain-containing protein n=1 Tax=Recurvomyces mirabilis TaxID=574656 RepID=A0AAE0WSW2_9PEZI|nr:hypothetical protein LTR78_002776 [Recurvomyces mirabilis]KAK5159490.1 hypothetical protein LTS14_002632 [Recurvomyces mirabilis]